MQMRLYHNLMKTMEKIQAAVIFSNLHYVWPYIQQLLECLAKVFALPGIDERIAEGLNPPHQGR